MKYLLLLTSIFFTSISLFSQQEATKIEITATDITLYPKITAENITLFGISLGMHKEEVQKILAANPQLYYYIDEQHATKDFRIYVYDRNAEGNKRNCILYLIWSENSADLNRITFFEDFAYYLQGNSSRLLTFEAVEPESKLAKTYLGKPDKLDVTLDIPSIKLKHTTYFYNAKGMEITLKESSTETTVVFAFVRK